MKKIIIICLISLVMMSTGCSCAKKEKPEVDQPAGNTNAGITQDQQVGDLQLKNTSLVMKNGESVLTTLVTNDTEQDIFVETFDIFAKDSNGNLLATSQGYVGGVVPALETREIITIFSIDLSKATSIEYQLNEK